MSKKKENNTGHDHLVVHIKSQELVVCLQQITLRSGEAQAKADENNK